MDNKEAFCFLNSHSSVRQATEVFLESYLIPDSEKHCVRRRFTKLKSDRSFYSKQNDLATWEMLQFHSLHSTSPYKKRLTDTSTVFQCELPQENRKPLSALTTKGLSNRLRPILDLVSCVAQNENVEPITIATYILRLYSGEARNHDLVNLCQQLIESGTFGSIVRRIPLDKSLFLLDFLEIGKRKYTKMRRLCKSENIIFPPYNKISEYRTSNILPISSDILEIQNSNDTTVGVGISYSAILKQTVLRLFEILPPILDSKYPLTLKISDGLDGSGCHKIYNQFDGIPNFNTKNFIHFGFKVISLLDSSSTTIWSNEFPNSPFLCTFHCINGSKRK